MRGASRSPSASPDGAAFDERHAYELPEHLVVVGSGGTGAELAHAYVGLGAQVTLVSSRERVLPGEDAATHGLSAWRLNLPK